MYGEEKKKGERIYKDGLIIPGFSLAFPFLFLASLSSFKSLPSPVESRKSQPVGFTTRNNNNKTPSERGSSQKKEAKMHMWTSVAVALLANSAAAQNMLRFACSQLVVDRVDPLVNPGVRYTPHLHQIVGGNSFNLTMNPVEYDLAERSSCTSCSFVQDLSNYWTAVMFFKHKNGSYHRIPQVGNGGPQGQLVNKGGLDVYYIPSGKVTAFKPVSFVRRGTERKEKERKANMMPGFPYACW